MKNSTGADSVMVEKRMFLLWQIDPELRPAGLKTLKSEYSVFTIMLQHIVLFLFLLPGMTSVMVMKLRDCPRVHIPVRDSPGT